MTHQEIKNLVLENAALKRLLQQKEENVFSIKEKVNNLKQEKKNLMYKLERSKNREKALKSALAEEQKKTFDIS
jgi:predicted RNase H-like nuclease (RuvC/YqgF family)